MTRENEHGQIQESSEGLKQESASLEATQAESAEAMRLDRLAAFTKAIYEKKWPHEWSRDRCLLEFAFDIKERELAAERERVMEECCRAVCEECEEGRPMDMWGKFWRHVYQHEGGMKVDSPCKADAIRRLLSKEPQDV